MAELSAPTVRVHRSFIAAMAELAAEGRGDSSDDSLTLCKKAQSLGR